MCLHGYNIYLHFLFRSKYFSAGTIFSAVWLLTGVVDAFLSVALKPGHEQIDMY